MADFDLSQVLAQANKVQAEASENSGGKEKLIYPQLGTLKVKLFFNPKTNSVIRKFERHTVGDTKTPCLQQYGMDCPICKILGDIENAKGIDLWKNKRTTRGICYAEYISDNYKWEKESDKPAPGEIIMLMFPWTVYQDLNRLMSQAGPNLAQVVASNVGRVVNIERYVQGSQTKYSASIDAFDTEHKTRETDEEYNQILMNLDSLNEKFVPMEVNDNIQIKAKEVAEQLSREYLNPVPQMNPNAGQNLGGIPTPPVPNPNYYKDPTTGQEYDLINNQWVPRMVPQTPPITPPVPPTPVPSAPSGQNLGGISNQNQGGFMNPPSADNAVPSSNDPVPAGAPACYGHHNDGTIDTNQCLVCYKEAECSSANK